MSQLSRRNFIRTMGLAGITGMLGACSSSSTDSSAGSASSSEAIAVCLASEPSTLDPALNSAVDGATMIVHLFSGLARWEVDDEGNYEIVADCAEELPEGTDNGDGTLTYTYTLHDGMTWSDGQPLTAGDFVYAWKRAASTDLGADYGYMYEQVVGYPDDLEIEAPDDVTFTVVINEAAKPYWNELLAFPALFPVREDIVSDDAWATDPSTYISNGAYTMTGWEHNSVITIEKNEDFHDADLITMGGIEFYLSDDANNMLTNFENGSWQLIDDVPTNEIATLKEEYPDEFKVDGQIGTYYVSWNINAEILPSDTTLKGAEAEKARCEIRNAIGLLIDRNYIVDDVAQGGQEPASSFVAMGMTDSDGSEFYENAGDSATNGYIGYYDTSEDALQSNYESAIETLKKYYTWDESSSTFTDFPSITYLYNTNESHKAIGEYLQSAFAAVGITMSLDNQEWATFLETRKAGDYTVARNGWLADYNYPMTFLDMWISDSGNNDVQFGKGDNENVAAYSVDVSDLGYDLNVTDGTWADTYDALIALIKAETDTDKAYALMHRAEDLLMSTGCICPIYFYTDLYMVDSNLTGFFNIPLGYKFFQYSSYNA